MKYIKKFENLDKDDFQKRKDDFQKTYSFLHNNPDPIKPEIEDFSEIKEGDSVYVNSYSSMGASSEGEAKVIKITKKYDEDTGEPYNQIHLEGGGPFVFDSRNGSGVGKSMFYITKK
jgi:hypothetical protein